MNTLPEFKDILQKDLSEMLYVTNTKNDLLEDFSFESLEHANKLIAALTTFTNALPKWILKGHTSDELQAKHPLNLNDPLFRNQVNKSFAKQFPDEPDNVVPFTPRPMVGRNDPCPCSSGKKYKKCCGDN